MPYSVATTDQSLFLAPAGLYMIELYAQDSSTERLLLLTISSYVSREIPQ